MSVAVQRQHGLGAAAPIGSSRRRVEPEDVAYALSARGRMGWQAIAKIRGVNELDLREACSGRHSLQVVERPAVVIAVVLPTKAPAALPAPKLPKSPKPPKPAPEPRWPERQLQVLQLIRDRVSTHQEIAAGLRIDVRNSIAVANLLRRKNLICGHAKPVGDWRVTREGRARLKAWEAATSARGIGQ